MKLLTIVGARPQFVKAAVVSRRRRQPDFAAIEEIIVHTGQHYDDNMSGDFFQELDIPPPKHNLGVGGLDHFRQIGAMLPALEDVFRQEKPDWALVYGDTNSTLAASLVAAKLAIPLAHVEAGLRSYRPGMAEEINRVVTDRLADLLFCPTESAAETLRGEGRGEQTHVVGDVMFDSFLFNRERAQATTLLKSFDLKSGFYILASIHRAENVDDPAILRAIIEGLGRAAQRIPVLFPVHPRTASAMKAAGLTAPPGLRLIAPVPYLTMIALLSEAGAVATDSGGVQKEAYFASVPCVTLRTETEWRETLDHGWNRLAAADPAAIAAALDAALVFSRTAPRPAHYGNGDSGERILRLLARH